MIYFLFALLSQDNRDAVIAFFTAALVMGGIFAALVFNRR
jgi:hypothetical protein